MNTNINDLFYGNVIFDEKAEQAMREVWLYDRDAEAKARVDADAEASLYVMPAMQDTKGQALWAKSYARMVAPGLAESPLELVEATMKGMKDKGMQERYAQEMQQLQATGKDYADDYYAMYARMNRDVQQKGWNDHQARVAERKREMGGLMLDLVRNGGERIGKGEAWARFFDGESRGVWKHEDKASVQNAAEAWDMMEGMLTDYAAAGAEMLTNATTPELIMDRLRGDEMAEALFFATLQDHLASMKDDAERRNFLVRFGQQFDAAGQKFAAGIMGGHFKPYVTDEKVEEYNAELPMLRERAKRAAMYGGRAASEHASISGFALEDDKYERIYRDAKASGQLNEDGTLRYMTQAEMDSTFSLDEFRGKLNNAVNGIYDIDGFFAKFGQMLPSSAAFVVPGGAAASFMSMRTQNLARELGNGEDWTRASVTATVDAAIQTAVEKIAFGSLNPTKMVFGLDKLMSQKLVSRALGGIYGTTAGRIGLGAAAGLAEELFVEPTAALLLAGVYNAAASTEFDLQDPVGEWKTEIEQMVQPDQLLATAVYGLLLGGVNVAGHKAAARDYREVLADLVELGVDEGKAAAIAREGNTVQRTKAIVGVLNERLKVDAGEVMALVAEKYPQMEGISVMENLHDKGQLPKLLPAGEGQVKVLEKDKEGDVTETIMSEEAARALYQSRLEDLDAETQLRVANMVLANAMVGTLSKDGQRWVISPEAEKMDHAYFQRLAHAAGLRLREGAMPEDIDPEVHPFIPLGSLAGQGKAWERRMQVERHEYERANGPVSDAEWEEIARNKRMSLVNRTGVRGNDGRLRTVLRVARGGFGAMQVLEDVSEDNLVRDMVANNRTLDFYIDNLRELESAMGRQGEFLRTIKDGESEADRRMAVIEAMGKVIQSKVLADTAREGNGLSAAVNAFLDWLRKIAAQVKAMFELGEAINKALTDKEAAAKLDPEFVADVDRLVQQDIEFLRELQLEDGLKAMQRVYKAYDEAMNDRRVKATTKVETPVLDAAEAEHGEAVRKEQAEREAVQAKVDADVAEGEAVLNGEENDFTASVEMEDIKAAAEADGTFMKAPNGKPTNLTEHQWLQVRTAAFKAWFGDWESLAYINSFRTRLLRLFSPEILNKVKGKDYNSIKSMGFDTRVLPMAYIPHSIAKMLGAGIADNLIYSSDFRLIEHLVNHHGEVTDYSGYVSQLLESFADPDRVYETKDRKKHRLLFVKGNKAIFVSIVSPPEQGTGARRLMWNTSYRKDNFNEAKYNLIWKKVEDVDAASHDKGPALNEPPAAPLSALPSTGNIKEKVRYVKHENVSKVVDENGEPKVVYHGSRRFGFSNFREIGDSFVIGQFFSDSLYVAQSYSDENGVTRIDAKDDPNYSVEFTREFGGYNVGGNYAVFLNIRKPLVFDAKGRPYNNLRDEKGNRISTDELAGKGRNAGFDGIIVNKVQDAGAYANMQGDWIDSYTATDYISFKPNQIKSATDNRGTFDGWDADITHSVVGENAENWDEIKHLAFRGRDDGKLRVELDASQAKVKGFPNAYPVQDVMRKLIHDGVYDSEDYMVYSSLEFAEDMTREERGERKLSETELKEDCDKYPDLAKEVELGLKTAGLTWESNVQEVRGASFTALSKWKKTLEAELKQRDIEKPTGEAWHALVEQKPGLASANVGKRVVGAWSGKWLDDVLDFPELYKAYPQLRSIQLAEDTGMELADASYTDFARRHGAKAGKEDGQYPFGFINMNPKSSAWSNEQEAKGLLLHEVQHAIQSIEGFAKGGNPRDVRETVEKLLENDEFRIEWLERDLRWFAAVDIARDYLKEAKRLRKYPNAWKYSGQRFRFGRMSSSAEEIREAILLDIAERYEAFRRDDTAETLLLDMNDSLLPVVRFSSLESIEAGLEKLNTLKSRKQAFRGTAAKKNRKLQDLQKRYAKMKRVLDEFKYEPIELYRRLAGEIEARNVELRRDWTAEERSATPFNDTLEYPGEALVTFSVVDSAAADYDDGQISFNVVSARDDDAKQFMREQMAMKGLSDEEINALMDRLESITAIVEAIGQKKDKKGKLKYGALARWNERDVLRYEAEGLGWIPRVSFFVKNGEYPVNMDAGTICVKREPLVRLVNRLVKEGLASRIGVTQMEQLKGLLKSKGILTGCDICFVEARRIRALQQASQLAFFWNAVRKAVGIEGNEPIGKNGLLTEDQQDRLTLLAGDLTPEQEAEWQKKSEGMETKKANELKRNMVKANQTAAYNKLVPADMKRVEKIDLGLSQGTMLKIVKIFQNAPTLAGKAEIDDFLSSESINYMLKEFPGSGIRTLLTSAFGAGTAKPLEDFNLYDELSWRAEEKDKLKALQELVDKTFKMGGARIQSFSDFNPLLFLDYYQMLLAFEWRMLPLQTYTKVPSFVALFGETGAKINMSLIPEVVDGVDAAHAGLKLNENGEWEFAWHKDSFNVDLAFKYREDEKMHANVGVVAVGISTEHVLMLLRDGRIDYVIPLHKSGMPLATQITTGLNKARDFTDVQTTRRWTEKKGKKVLEAVTVLKKTDKKEDVHKRLSKTFNERLMELGDAKLAAADYLRECDEKGFVPAFDEFRNEENYYKLLVDFRVYDKHGKPAPQGVVQAKLPTDWAAIWEKAVASREAEEAKVETELQEDSFMEEARAILDVTPLEGKVRATLVDKLRTALGGEDKVEFLNSADFTARARELSGARTAFRKANGEVYGFTHGGTIILREDSFNANTPAHAFTHIWAKVAQKANPKLWAEGVELLKKTALWRNVKEDALYQGIRSDDDAVAGEVLARFAASLNDQRVQELTDPHKKQLLEKGILARVMEWVRTIWKDVRSIFGKVDKRPLTLQEFTKMPLCDLWVKTRNTKFRNYLKKNPLEEREELEQAEAEFSASIVSIDEGELVADVAAAGSGFRANLEFSRQITREANGALERLKRIGSKTRTEREDAIAAMGTVVQVVKAAVAYLPRGYRFSVHPYLKKLEVLAELASTGDVELTKDMANKTIKEWLKLNKGIDDVVALKGQELDRQTAAEELAKEYGEMHLQDALEAIMRRVAGQLRKHAKDKTVLKIKQLVERIKPKKDKKTGKLKGGKMSADAYRDIEEVAQAMAMGDDEIEDKLAALNKDLATPGLSEERRAQIESEMAIYDQFGNLQGMTPEETVEAYEALRQRVWFHRFEWDNVMAERRAARKEVIRRVVDGVGRVGTNEYNEKKRVLKPSKRLKHVADILSGMPSVLTGLKGFLALRELANDLSRRANRAGEQLKRWEAERWLELEALSRKTLGKSWRKSMDYMHEVLPTGVAFDRPKYRTVSIKTDALRELLAMSKEDRKAEMKRRREAGGLEAETEMSERDVAELSKVLNAMEQNDRVLSTVEARYVSSVDHEDNLRLSRGNALYAILMHEQPTYTERLEAQGYTPEVIAGLKRFVGEGMLQFGYGLRDMLAKQGDRIAEVYERTFGVPFPREVNYFAARWNVTEMKANSAEQLLAGMAGTPGAANGWMKQRVKHDLELDMTKDALQVFLQATSLTDTWMATQDIVADFKAYTRDADFDRAMVATLGEEGYENLKDWVRILEQGGVQDCLNMGASQDVINGLYGAGAVAILGFRIQTLLRQLPSVLNGLLGAHDITTAEYFAALSKLKRGEAPMTYKRMKDSTLLKNRQQGVAGNMASQAMRSGYIASSAAEGLLLASMLPMEKVDAACTAFGLVPVWNVYYQRAVSKGASVQEAEQAAWEQTTEVANLASQPIGWLNKSKIAQSRNPLVKSVFYMLSENTAKFAMARALWRGGNKLASVRAWLFYGAANAIISALLDALQGDPEKWEEAKWWEYVLSAIYGPAASLPFIGELLEAIGSMVLNVAGEAFDVQALKKARMRASVGRALIDVRGSWRAANKLYEMLTDDKEHTLAEYTRASSTISRSLSIGTGWLGNAFGYWSTVVAVLMNPIDFGARVWRNMRHYFE